MVTKATSTGVTINAGKYIQGASDDYATQYFTLNSTGTSLITNIKVTPILCYLKFLLMLRHMDFLLLLERIYQLVVTIMTLLNTTYLLQLQKL